MAAQVAAQTGELSQVVGRLVSRRVIGRGEIIAGGFRQQPVQPNNLQARIVGLATHFGSLGWRNIVRVHVDRERRNLQTGIAKLSGKRKRLLERPVLKRLVANGEAHRWLVLEEGLRLGGNR